MSEEHSAEKDATTRVEREHRWFDYGRWFNGFGSSMDPHYCDDPRSICEWRERTVTTGPWSDWTRVEPRAECAAQYGSNPDRCYREAGHAGAHSNRYGTTWASVLPPATGREVQP